MIAPKPVPPRIATHATKKRRAYARRARYAGSVRVLGLLSLIVFPIMVYVMLTANLTGLNYALTHAQNERSELQQEVQRLDDRVAHLESRERLAQVAAKLGMRDPQGYAVVAVPPVEQPPKPKIAGIALLGWFNRP